MIKKRFDLLTNSKESSFSFSIPVPRIGIHTSFSLYPFSVDRLNNGFSVQTEGEVFKCKVVWRWRDVAGGGDCLWLW